MSTITNIKKSFQKVMDDLEYIESSSQRELLIDMGNQMITRANEIQKMADECDGEAPRMACKIGASSNLMKWIEGDDACDISTLTIISYHDPSHDGEKSFIIDRIRSLFETGVSLKSITLNLVIKSLMTKEKSSLKFDHESFMNADYLISVVQKMYDEDATIESIELTVAIK